VHPAGRPEPGTLAILTREVLGRAAPRNAKPLQASEKALQA
jgi:hypothetical protein